MIGDHGNRVQNHLLSRVRARDWKIKKIESWDQELLCELMAYAKQFIKKYSVLFAVFMGKMGYRQWKAVI